MPRHIRIGLIALAAVLIVGTAYYYRLQERIAELVRPHREVRQPFLAEVAAPDPSAAKKSVILFFPSPERDGLLESEQREIRASADPAVEARQILAELIRGPSNGYSPALPSETRLREVYVLEDGLAVVDFSTEVSTRHPGGLTQEISTIYCVVNSLSRNVSAIQRVRILIEGREAESLAGHVGLAEPFEPDLSMTQQSVPTAGSGSWPGSAKSQARILEPSDAERPR
ncbi:MAG: GerMN domain-containing protein [Acidobacteriota bacterium]